MEKVRALIAKHRDRYPEFEYHSLVIDKAIANVKTNPDVSIECSKSLIEGVCKNIIKHVNASYSPEIIEKYKLRKAATNTLIELSKYDGQIEEEFIEKLVDTVEAVGKIRNIRGDVSHGHIAPKFEESTSKFAQMIMAFADIIIGYLLDVFYAIDFLGELDVAYSNNPEFNDHLDDLYPLDGKPIYSRALYDQYYKDYLIQLDQYRDEMEELEE